MTRGPAVSQEVSHQPGEQRPSSPPRQARDRGTAPSRPQAKAGGGHKPDPRRPAKFCRTPEQPHLGGLPEPRRAGRLQAPPAPQPTRGSTGGSHSGTRQRGGSTPKHRGGARLGESAGDGPRPAPRALPAAATPETGDQHPPPRCRPRPGGRGRPPHTPGCRARAGRARSRCGARRGPRRCSRWRGAGHPAPPQPARAAPSRRLRSAPLRCARSAAAAAPARPRRAAPEARPAASPNRRRRRHARGQAPQRDISARARLEAEPKERGAGPGGRGPVRTRHANQMGVKLGEGRGLPNRKAESSEGGGARR